jgi:CBS-domain-containing membrane protein
VRVANVLEPAESVARNATLHQILDRVGHDINSDVQVVDDNGMVLGVITMADLARVARDQHEVGDLVVAADLAVATEVVMPQDSLLSAIQKFQNRSLNALPVLDPETGKLLGVVSRTNILSAYEAAVKSGL